MNKPDKSQIQELAKQKYYENLSLAKIGEELEKAFGLKIGRTTILGWADKFGWKKNRDEAVVKGFLEAKTESIKEDEESTEEILLKKIREETAKQYKENLDLRKSGLSLFYTELKKQKENSDYDPKLLKAGLDAFKIANDDIQRIENKLSFASVDLSKLSDAELEMLCHG